MAATLAKGCVFRGTDEDLPVFEKLANLCPGYSWRPTVAACTTTLILPNKHCGCKISGNTAKSADPEFYRSDAMRIATLWAKMKKSTTNKDHYQAVLESPPGSSSDDSQPLDAGARAVSALPPGSTSDDSQSVDAGPPARKKLKGPIIGRRPLVLRAPGAPMAATTVGSEEQLEHSSAANAPDAPVETHELAPVASSSVASTVAESDSDGTPLSSPPDDRLPDSSSRHEVVVQAAQQSEVESDRSDRSYS